MRPQEQQQQQQQQQQQNQEPRPRTQVVYTREGHEGRLQTEQSPNRIVVIVPDQVFRLFVRQVYMYGVIFVLIACITWLGVSGARVNLNDEVPVPFYAWFIISFILLVILQCCPKVRYIFPLNWILTILIVVCVTLAAAYIACMCPAGILAIGLFIAVVVFAILHIAGAMLPQRVLPGGLVTGCLMLIIMVVLLVFMFLMFFLSDPVFALIFYVVMFLLLVLAIPFHSQYINGRLDIVPIFDMLSCAITIFIHFVLMVFCIIHFHEYHMLKVYGITFL